MNIDNVDVHGQSATVTVSNGTGASARVTYTNAGDALDMDRESIETCLQGTQELREMGMVSGVAKRKFGIKFAKAVFAGKPNIRSGFDREGFELVIGRTIYVVQW